MVVIFFFSSRRRHTRFDCDWSSDVCSSDLRLVAARPGWTVVLAPTLHLGSFTFDAPGTVSVRQRVVRDALVAYGVSLARAGFRYILVANGHAGPGHLAALDEAAATVSPRDGMPTASFTGHLAWQFLRSR